MHRVPKKAGDGRLGIAGSLGFLAGEEIKRMGGERAAGRRAWENMAQSLREASVDASTGTSLQWVGLARAFWRHEEEAAVPSRQDILQEQHQVLANTLHITSHETLTRVSAHWMLQRPGLGNTTAPGTPCGPRRHDMTTLKTCC